MTTLPTDLASRYPDNPADGSVEEHQLHHDVIHRAVNSTGILDGFEWEKWSTGQSIADGSAQPDWGGMTTVTGWEATPNIGSEGSLEDCFDPVTGIFTPAESGWYQMAFQVQFAANANGLRRSEVSIVHAVQQVPSVGASNATRMSAMGFTYLDGPGNEHERFFTGSVVVKQTSGGPLNLTYAAFHIIRL